jgi:L-fuculose-phosphate aldolase
VAATGDETDAAAEAIVAAGRRLGDRNLITATEGNLSIRLHEGRLLVTPSGRRKDELAAGDLIAVDAATGRAPSGTGRPTSDIAIHLAIYAARPDVAAIAHAHLPAALALTLVGELPNPAVLPETALLLPSLPFVPFGRPGSHELAARIAGAFLDTEPTPGAVLLERHGAVAVGSTIGEAVDRLELVDLLCRVWRDARLLAPALRPVAP